jgi:phospholipase C
MERSVKTITSVLLLCLSAYAQQFQHIVIIVQENRTPDNLFSNCGIPDADLQSSPFGTAVPLAGGADMNHTHNGFLQNVEGIYSPQAYDFVDATTIQPYCQLATTYGFADRMFQTNQGPSFPAHQFLVSGSSTLSDATDTFASDNPISGSSLFCRPGSDSIVPTIDSMGDTGTASACFNRSSLLDLLAAGGISFEYYAADLLWMAPEALANWYGTETTKKEGLYASSPEVLNDISAGTLASVVWVTPAETYSDHPSTTLNYGLGPSWVSSIVNAIGNSSYWPNTAIVVTWDDWGGFWDHIPPMVNDWGALGNTYIGGFRVPLLVISAFTPAMVDHDQHDFGSILRFVESNFSLSLIGPGVWADAYADGLSAFFPLQAPRAFQLISAPAMTKDQLADTKAPDEGSVGRAPEGDER